MKTKVKSSNVKSHNRVSPHSRTTNLKLERDKAENRMRELMKANPKMSYIEAFYAAMKEREEKMLAETNPKRMICRECGMMKSGNYKVCPDCNVELEEEGGEEPNEP